jgi:hypothetical protein
MVLLHGERAYYIGSMYFPNGDMIQITSVTRTKDKMTVKGHYNLVSQDKALLMLSITSSSKGGPVGDRQKMRISKGQGDFALIHTDLVPGYPHVVMYNNSGNNFANVYFGTKAEAAAEKKMQ